MTRASITFKEEGSAAWFPGVGGVICGNGDTEWREKRCQELGEEMRG